MIQLTAVEIQRFHAKIGRPGDSSCRLWTGELNGKGYGRFPIYRGGRRRLLAHRLVLTLELGRPVQSLVLHSCDNPPCCEPGHLYEGCQAQNIQDAQTRARLNLVGLRSERERQSAEARTRAEVVHATGMKRCSMCRQIKPITNFWRQRSTVDGLNCACKTCFLARYGRNR